MTGQITNTGTVQNPYRQFDLVIPAGQSLKHYYDTQNIMILENSLKGKLQIDFQGSGGQTFIETGIKYKLEQPISYIHLYNADTDNAMYLKIALGMGEVDDNRLTISSSIVVEQKTEKLLGYETAAIGAGGSVTLNPNGAASVIIQNKGDNNIFLFDADGIEIVPRGTFEKGVSSPVTVHGTPGDKVGFARFG